LDGTADQKLTGFALRLVLSDHVGIPHESQPDLLSEAEQVFAPRKPKVVAAKGEGSDKPKPKAAKTTSRKEAPGKKVA
jgi:ParB family chromosome partitioning protein